MFAAKVLAAVVLVPLVAAAGAVSRGDRAADRHFPEARVSFEEAVTEYAELHRRLASPLGGSWLTSDAEQLLARSRALARALAAARPAARAGDIFTPPVARMFRQRIARNVRTNGYDVQAIIAGAIDDERQAAVPPLAVNKPFPWDAPAVIWPSMIAELPPLPPELEYRFVGYALVLLDVDASLIVDVLPYALPAVTETS